MKSSRCLNLSSRCRNASVAGAVSFLQLFAGGTAYAALETRLNLTMSQTNYAGEAQISQQEKAYSAFAPELDVRAMFGMEERTHQKIRAQAIGILPMSDNVDSGIAIPELYFQDSRLLVDAAPSRSVFTVGRMKENWSELDNHWHMGIWQPLVRWDAASPIEQGLSGVFYSFSYRKTFRVTAMASGIFIPDQQAEFEEKDGKLVSSNRWFRAPVHAINNDAGDLNWDLDLDMRKPDTRDVVFRETYVGQMSFGDHEAGLYVTASIADKPANQFHLAVDTESSVGADEIQAPLYPVVVRHRLYTGEASYAWKYSRLLISSTLEQFEAPNIPTDWLQTALVDARYDGFVFTQNLTPLGIKRSRISLSYVKRTEQTDPQKATILNGELEASTQRFQFNEMGGFDIDVNIFGNYRRQLDFNAKYVYSVSDEGEWIQAGMRYKHDQEWTWALSGDVFGVPEGAATSETFISKFRGNDRVMGSMTYVF